MDPQDNGVDPAFSDAVQFVESSDNPDATGPETKYGRAKGLMQLLDTTGEAQMQKLGIEGEYDPYNPELNKRLGNAELKDQLDSSGGDEALAAAKYNYGSGNVTKLQKKYGDSYQDIAAHLPSETKQYVVKVLDKKAALEAGDSETGKTAPENYPGTAQGFAQALLPIVSSPTFDSLPLSEKASEISKVYGSKKWGPQAYDVLKQVMTNYTDAAPDAEKPDLNQVVDPPPRVQPGQDGAAVVAAWKQQQLIRLYKSGVSPAIFGTSLDKHLEDAAQNELQANSYRNRGVLGEIASGTYATGLNITKGAAYGFSKPTAALARLAGFEDTANTIEDAPELLGKPVRDYIYDTDENGYLIPNADGSLRTKWQTDAEQMVGQIGSFIAGGSVLKTLGFGARAVQGTLLAANTLTVANDSFRSVYEETGGDTSKAYKASIYSIPAGAVGALGDYAVVAKWANPVLSELSSFNKATYLANVFARNAAVGAAANAGLDVVAQFGENQQTGNAYNPERTASAAFGGAVAGGVLATVHARNNRPPEADGPQEGSGPIDVPEDQNAQGQKLLPAPPSRTLISGPEERKLLQFPTGQKQLSGNVYGPDQEAAIPLYAPTTAEEQSKVVKGLENFQKSKASELTLTPEQAKQIPPELFSVFQVTPSSDGQTALVTKIERYLQRDSGTLEGVDHIIETLKGDLEKSPSPENVQSLIEERASVKKELKSASADLNEQMTGFVRERQEFTRALDAAKEQAENQTDPVLKKVARLEQTKAEEDLQTFDELHPEIETAHQGIQPLSDRLDELNTKLKDVLSPTYANDLKAKERNLETMIKKRQLLADVRRQETEADNQQKLSLEAEKERSRQRGEALAKLGIEADPTLDFSNGVRVQGHTVVPIGEKWYVIDRFGELQGTPHSYYYDAVDSITKPRENLDRSFTTTSRDRTALSPEDSARIREEVSKTRSEEERVAQLKADTQKQAEEYRSKVHADETKAAQKAAQKEIAQRKKKNFKEGKTSTVTALEDPSGIRGLTDTATPPAEGAKEVEQTTVAPRNLELSEARSKTRRYISKPQKPLTSNYTPLLNFKENSEAVVKPKEIFDQAQKTLSAISKNTKIFQGGKVPKGVLGFINPLRDYINNARHNDILTLAHELMHGIDRAVIGRWHNDTATPDWSHLPSKVIEAAKDMADTFYGRPLQNEDLRIQEGLAMFFQHYASGQPYRKEIGNWYHTDFAKENPQTYKGLEALKSKMFDYYNQTPGAAVRSNVVPRPNPTTDKAKRYFTWKNLKDQWVDRSSIFTDVDKVTGAKGRVKDYWDANHKRGKAVAESLLERGQVRANGKIYSTFSLDEAFAPAKGKYDQLEEYLIAKNEQANYQNKGLEGGGNIEDVNKVIDNADAGVVRAANNYYRMLDTLHDVVADTSKEGRFYIQKLQEENLLSTGTKHGYYIPFPREGKIGFNPTSKRIGSTRSKVDPVGHISDAFETILTKSFQSQVKQQLAELATGPHASSIGLFVREVTGMEKRGLEEKYNRMVKGDSAEEPTANQKVLHSFFSEPIDGVSSTDFKVMPYMDGTRVKFFEVDPRITKAFKDELPDFINSAWFKYLIRPGAQILRPAATSLRIAFQIKNLIRDPVTAWRYINSGEDTPGLSGFKDALLLAKNISSNIVDTTLGGKMSQWAKESGLQYANRAGAVEDVRSDLQKRFGKNFLDWGQGTLNAFERFISAPEQATRLASVQVEAKRLGIHDLNQPLTPAQELDLLLAYKRSTTNFGIQGSSARVVNLGVPFFTARINELTRLPGDFKRNPSRFAAYGLGMFAYGIYHALAHGDQEWYQEMTPDAKMNSAWFRMNVNGVEKAISVPIESEGALFWGLGQAIGNKMINDPALPLEYSSLARAYFSMNVTPVNSVLDLTTPWGKEAIQQFANKDQFTGRQIVPPSLEYQSPAQQYTEMTSELAKSVGARTGISPIRLDHALRSVAPAAADAAQFMDRALGFKTEKDVQSSNFVINALARSGTTAHIADRAQLEFTDKLLAARANKFEETPEEGQVRKTLERMNKDMSNINTVLTAGDMTQEERDTLRRTRVQILKEGITIATSGQIGPVTNSGTKSQAQGIRNRRTEELQGASEKKKKAASSDALKGETE